MTEAQPLLLHPFPMPDDVLALIRTAFEELQVPFPVIPSPSVPGAQSRVLCLTPPPWLCDAGIIRDPKDPASVKRSLEWVLLAPEGDDRGFMVSDYLTALLGPEVREIPKEEWDA